MFDSDSTMPLVSATSATVTKHQSPVTSHHSLSPFPSNASTLFCTFLHSPKTQSFSFHTLPHSFTKTKGGHISSKTLFPDPKLFRIRISPIEDQNETANC